MFQKKNVYMSKNHHPDLSVIVPVYNTGAFLGTCLNSILSQEGVNMEIIIVNDGSTDDSAGIIKQYQHKDKRIRSIYQINQGLSVARNTGLELAGGDYVLFVDSDDWILPDSLGYYLRLARKSDVDVVVGKVNIFYDNGTVGFWSYIENLHNEQPVMSGVEYLNMVVQYRQFAPMVYTYICRCSMLQQANLLFEPGLIHEDELWTPHMLLHAKSVTFGAIPHYAYRRRTTGSITSSTKQSVRLSSLIRIIRIMTETYCSMAPSSPAYPFFIMDIRAIYRTCAQIALRNTDSERMAFEEMSSTLNSRIVNDDIINAMWHEYGTIIQSQKVESDEVV